MPIKRFDETLKAKGEVLYKIRGKGSCWALRARTPQTKDDDKKDSNFVPDSDDEGSSTSSSSNPYDSDSRLPDAMWLYTPPQNDWGLEQRIFTTAKQGVAQEAIDRKQLFNQWVTWIRGLFSKPKAHDISINVSFKKTGHAPVEFKDVAAFKKALDEGCEEIGNIEVYVGLTSLIHGPDSIKPESAIKFGRLLEAVRDHPKKLPKNSQSIFWKHGPGLEQDDFTLEELKVYTKAE